MTMVTMTMTINYDDDDAGDEYQQTGLMINDDDPHENSYDDNYNYWQNLYYQTNYQNAQTDCEYYSILYYALDAMY